MTIRVSTEDQHLLCNHIFTIKAGYATTMIDGKCFYLHKLIMPLPGIVDHKDRDKLNCTRDNLRYVNHSQNGINRKINSNNISGYTGVYKEGNKWRAAVMVDNVTRTVGSFNTKEQAALERDIAAKYFHGQYARLNFDLNL